MAAQCVALRRQSEIRLKGFVGHQQNWSVFVVESSCCRNVYLELPLNHFSPSREREVYDEHVEIHLRTPET